MKPTTSKSGLRVNRVVLKFRQDKLPPAREVYEREIGKLTRPNRKGWCQGRCPFHESKSGKSFSVNLDNGGFHCFGCDAKGGDVIDFVRRRYGLSFIDACKSLGACDESGDQFQPQTRPEMLVKYLSFDFDIDGVHHHASVKDEPRNYAVKIRRFYREASQRLIELGRGDAEAYAGEQETCWARMACAMDELRELKII